MHFEILVEDASGKILLEHLVPKIIGPKERPHSFRIINIQDLKHRVMMRMPRHLARTLPWDTILFQTLAIQLRAYGKSLPRKNGVVIILVDLDYRNSDEFLGQLRDLFAACDPKPSGDARAWPSKKAKHGYWATPPRFAVPIPWSKNTC